MSEPNIVVTPAGEDRYDVEVREGSSTSRHRVTVTEADRTRYGGDTDAPALLEASFRFLLAREPKEAIMSRFELPVIERYFPEYPKEIGKLLD